MAIDSREPYDLPLNDVARHWTHWPSLPVLALIRLYQRFVSPLLPADSCRFTPTCSHYGYQAIVKFGLLRGGAKAIWRILRCQPFNPGGYDPVK
jgi:putative membrane protein insertion efficiency factor